MAVHLPLMMQQMFNTPLALHDKKAEVICAVLANKLNLSSFERTWVQGGRLEREDLADTEALARRNAIAGITNAPPPAKTTDGWYGDRPYQISSSGIAMIQVWGTLTRTWGVGPDSGFTGYDGIMTQVDFAMRDEQCRGIFIHFNSGGGAVDGMIECSDFIYNCSARNGGKPIFGYAGDYAYSAAYCQMAACDQLYVSETGGVGSIGCLTLHVDMTKALEDDGIDVLVFRSTPGKALGAFGQTLPQNEIDRVQAQIEKLGSIFVKRVATYMPALTQDAVAKTNGLDYMGDEAKAAGLVTDVLPMHEAWAKLERRIAR